MKKILSSRNIEKTLSGLRSKKKKVSLCHGVFDVLHLGHIEHFKIAKKKSDILIVSVTSDKYVKKGHGRPFFKQDQRMKMLSSIEIIDYIILSNSPSAVDVINQIKPNYYIKGIEYKKFDLTGKIVNEKNAVEKNKGKIIYTNAITFSSSNILNNFSYNDEQLTYLNEIKKRYTSKNILTVLDKLKKIKVLVLGEVIIDEYNFCEPLGKSGKEPYLAIKNIYSETYLGGAAAVANHISDFVHSTNLCSLIGNKNEYLKFINQKLKKNISKKFFKKKDSPTILKKRYIENVSKNKLFGVYNLNDDLMNKNDANKIIKFLKKNIRKFDLIVIADYGHGLINDEVIKIVKRSGKTIALNAQVNAANIGYHNLNRYKGVSTIIINENELRHEMRNKNLDIDILAQQLISKLKIKKLIVTRGKNGAIMFNKNEKIYCPAFAKNVIDKVGAGDTMLSIISLCIKAKIDDRISLLLGSLAGAHSVENIGNSVFLDKLDFLRFVENSIK